MSIYKNLSDAVRPEIALGAAQPKQQAEPPPEWPLIKNILAVFGLDAISFVAKWKAAQQKAEPVADGDKVICPACCHQFRGIPETVQTLMLHAGFEPPFTTPPQQQAEPVQEPVARVIDNGTPEGATEWIPFTNRVEPLETGDLLYTAPPQRPWVGLTVTTILNMMPSAIPAEYDGELMQFARDLEAKLKERNGY